jgi:hypothetical protein
MKSHATSFLLLVLLIPGIEGCATSHLTPEQQSQLANAMACPLEFTVPKSQSADAWGRAQTFIGRFSSMKLQVVTDYVIQTYNPDPNGLIGYGYYVTRTPTGSGDEFTVKCITNNIFSGGEANRNAHIAAYYIKNGMLLSYGISN